MAIFAHPLTKCGAKFGTFGERVFALRSSVNNGWQVSSRMCARFFFFKAVTCVEAGAGAVSGGTGGGRAGYICALRRPVFGLAGRDAGFEGRWCGFGGVVWELFVPCWGGLVSPFQGLCGTLRAVRCGLSRARAL